MSENEINKPFYFIKSMPVLQNKVYDTVEEALSCDVGDISLIESKETGLIFNESFISSKVEYDSSYNNEQAISPKFQMHLDSVANIINERMGKENLIEVGCGKGYFLNMLAQRSFDIKGFDPAYEGQNKNIIKRIFQSGENISAHGIILRHVLEHIKNPVDFLENIKLSNKNTGLIYIEVPCFDWICKHKAWFDICYEHVNYFRLSDFYRMFGEVVDSGSLFGDQYIYVVAELKTLKMPQFDFKSQIKFPQDFLSSLKDKNSSKEQIDQSAIWGGSTKGVIFSILKAREGYNIRTIIDINPAKQGKYLPVTGARVYSAEKGLSRLSKGATIYVANSNYLEEIKRMSNNLYHYISIDDE